MFCKNGPFNSLLLDIVMWKEFVQLKEAWLVPGLIVIAIEDLTLQCSKMYTLIASTRVTPINNRISQLDIKQIELHWIITMNIFVREEEFFSESEHS